MYKYMYMVHYMYMYAYLWMYRHVHMQMYINMYRYINAGMPDYPASGQSSNGMKKLTMPEHVRTGLSQRSPA
jgi:hypothetical protein